MTYAQSPQPGMIVFVRVSRDATSVGNEIRRAVHDVAPQLPVYDMQTMTEALIKLVVAGVVDEETAASGAPNRHDFLIALHRALKEHELAQERTDVDDEPVSADFETVPLDSVQTELRTL